MAVTYTSAALVKKRSKGISADLLDADIEANIYEAENIIDVTMKDSFKTSFDAVKHAIIQQCCTDLAAFLCITYDPSSFISLADAEFSVNLLWNSAERSLSLLSDSRTVDYLKSL